MYGLRLSSERFSRLPSPPPTGFRPGRPDFETTIFGHPFRPNRSLAGQEPRYPFSPFLSFLVNGGLVNSGKGPGAGNSYIPVDLRLVHGSPGGTFVQGQAHRLAAPSRPFLLGKEAEVAWVRDDLPVFSGGS